MGWFDEQIRQRIEYDDDTFSESFYAMANRIMGDELVRGAQGKIALNKGAIQEILRFYGIKEQEIPASIKDLNDQLEYLMRPTGVMRRYVALTDDWYLSAYGAMLATMEQGNKTVALIPDRVMGYTYYDQELEKRVRVTAERAKKFDRDAICFYIPFPARKLSFKDIITYVIKSISPWDVLAYLIALGAVSGVGLFIPYVSKMLYGTVIPSGRIDMLVGLMIFYIGFAVSKLIFEGITSVFKSHLSQKLMLQIESAGMMRIFSMPAKLFKDYQSGDLTQRVLYFSQLGNLIIEGLLNSGFTALFSFVYIGQMSRYGRKLVGPAMLVILINFIATILITIGQSIYSKVSMEANTKRSAMEYALINGVAKIKLAGAEKRAFSKWAGLYKESIYWNYAPTWVVKASFIVSNCINLVGTLVIFTYSLKYNISTSDYFGFQVAFGMVMMAFVSLTGMATTFAQIKPMLDMLKPIMENEPENSSDKQMVTKISGAIELSHISFRYRDDMPLILDDISLRIDPGQYVAIVGATGCGKSTLMRLLLGLETPNKGSIFYDNKDLKKLDIKSVRKHIGTVLQNGKVFTGDIFSNITVSAPWLTLDDAWKAAEIAGLKEDIENMPMKMMTMLSDGGGGISGGQRQRLMIARAIAPKPKILMFDEATSALDNITQKNVSDALEGLKCTRLVIAHRLSTIIHCDRIIVLDKGKIVEDGTYDELIQLGGLFKELVERQQLDSKGN